MRATEAFREEPFFAQAGSETIFGILTVPREGDTGDAMIVLPGGSAPTSTGRNRLSVRLTRHAAAHGWLGVRFDFHGVGESTGVAGRFRLDAPFRDDLLGVVRWLRERRGITRIALVGSCFGSRTALAVADDPDVRAMCLIAAPPRDFEMGHRISTGLAVELSVLDYFRRALRPKALAGLLNSRRRRSYARILKAKWRAIRRGSRRRKPEADDWISPAFLGQMSASLERNLPIVFLYGAEDVFLQEFRTAMHGSLGRLLSRDECSAVVKTVPGHLHGTTEVSIQDTVVELVTDWLATIPRHRETGLSDGVDPGEQQPRGVFRA